MQALPGPRPWSATAILLVSIAVVYALQLIVPLVTKAGGTPWSLEDYLALYPVDLKRGFVWQLLSFQFLHVGPFHLLINGAMLYMFGRPVEMVLGSRRFVTLYLVSGAAGGLLQVACSWLFRSHFGLGPVLGASAGVFAVIAAFAALHWNQSLTLLLAFIIPVTLKAKYLLIVELLLAVFGMLEPRSGVAHAAHLGGMLGGLAFVYLAVYAERRLRAWQRPRLRPHRELVGASAARGRAGHAPPQPAPAEDLPPAEFISREVDPILDKISAHGIQSLTPRERQILERARARISKR